MMAMPVAAATAVPVRLVKAAEARVGAMVLVMAEGMEAAQEVVVEALAAGTLQAAAAEVAAAKVAAAEAEAAVWAPEQRATMAARTYRPS